MTPTEMLVVGPSPPGEAREEEADQGGGPGGED